ncbi:MAG TPA: hypothetical protein VFG89_04880 [Coriobacteriia bacterium]|nr:hypothetical protein [Coriobacteriia bacterium]
MSRVNRIALSAFLVAALVAVFLATTALADAIPDAATVALLALGALLFAALVAQPSPAALLHMPRSAMLAGLGAGLLMGFAAPLLLITNRLTDAPPGSEVLFFTTAGWALIAVVVALLVPDDRPSAAQIALACVGVLGVATLVANWERPSSFSPFVRYPVQESWLLVAGVAWAVGSILLRRVRGASDHRAAVFMAAAAAAVVAVAYALIAEGPSAFVAATDQPTASLVALVAFGVLFATWTQLLRATGIVETSSLLFLPAVGVTALGVAEQAVAAHGPDPIVWAGALGGAALCALAALLIPPMRGAQPVEDALSGTRTSALAIAVSGVAAVLGTIALALPAFTAAVSGTLASGEAYSVTWALAGYESAGGWAVALAGILLLVAAMNYQTARRAVTWMVAVAAFITGLSYLAVASTPLHTWNRWVPTDLQSEYGTEYVSLSFATVHHPVRLAALIVAVLAVGVITMTLLRAKRAGGSGLSEVGS